MMTFADFVRHHLTVRGWSPGDLAERLGYESHGYVTNVLSGLRPPPLKRIEDWGKALKLGPEDQETLILLAESDHIPPRSRLRIERLERKIEALEKLQFEKDHLISDLQKRMALLSEKVRGRSSREHQP